VPVNVKIRYSHNGAKHSQEPLLLLDSGSRDAVVSSPLVRNAQPVFILRENPTPISDSSGNPIPGSGLHFMMTLDMSIGDHTIR